MGIFIVTLIIGIILFQWFMHRYALFLLRKNKVQWNPSFMEQVRFIYLHATGNHYRYCKYFHSIAQSNKVFFSVYRCWLHVECMLILALLISLLLGIFIILTISFSVISELYIN